MTSTHKTEFTAKTDQFECGLLGALEIRSVEACLTKSHETGVLLFGSVFS